MSKERFVHDYDKIHDKITDTLTGKTYVDVQDMVDVCDLLNWCSCIST